MAHAYWRGLERFGKPLDGGLAAAKIQRADGKFLGRQSKRISFWRLTLDGTEVIAVYDTKRHVVVSYLPLEARIPPYHD